MRQKKNKGGPTAILMTGSTGYLGNHLSRSLVRHG